MQFLESFRLYSTARFQKVWVDIEGAKPTSPTRIVQKWPVGKKSFGRHQLTTIRRLDLFLASSIQKIKW